jgi:hypothetical protein
MWVGAFGTTGDTIVLGTYSHPAYTSSTNYSRTITVSICVLTEKY